MGFIAGIEESTFAVGRKGEVPDVFCLGIEENGFVTRSSNSVNLAVGRSADIESAFGVKGNGLRGEVRGIEDDGRFAIRIEAKYSRGRAAGSVERALGIEPDRPEIGSIRVGEQSEFGREFEAAIAAHRHAMRGAFEEFIVCGLAPAASVLGEGRREAQKEKEVKDIEEACS